MLVKILQIIVFQGLFLFIYDFWFRKETFYTSNRFYLIATSLLAVILPFITINISTQSSLPTQIIALGEVVLNPQNFVLPEVFLSTKKFVSVFPLLLWIYFIGALISSSLFIWKLLKVIRLIDTNKKQQKRGFVLIFLKDSTSVFSFLNYIFIGENIKDKNFSYLLAHEKVHIQQLHSLDLLWFEILKIILWFNPFVYLYQKQIIALHEFIADAESIKTFENKTYYNYLLNDLFQVENMAFVNQFYNKSLIQKRITMMTQTQSQKWKRMKYLFLIPIFSVIVLFSCKTQNITKQENAVSQKNTDDEFQKKAEKFTQFIELHPDSNHLSETDYNEYIKLLKDIGIKKEVKSFKIYQEEVRNNKEYFLYQVSRANDERPSINNTQDGTVPFSTIDEVPIYPGCEDIQDKAEQRECLSRKIQEHVSKNFNVDMAQNLGLTPGKKRIFTLFTIDKEGNITSIRSRAPHKELELEAVRVIQTLPKMKPGKQQGKLVSVKYSLPITFIVEEGTSKKKK